MRDQLVSPTASGPRGLRSVSNALRVIEAIVEADRSLSVSEVAQRLGLGASSTHRLLSTLVGAGFARQDPDRRYGVGPTLARIGARSAAPPLLRDAARPVIRWLARASGESAHLAVLDGMSVVSIDHVAGTHPGDVGHVVGARLPAHATALGLALLAHHPRLAESAIVGGLDQWTPRTPIDEATFRRSLDAVVRRGYAVNVRGWLEGTAGLAAPVLLGGREAVAAVGVSGPAERLGRRRTILELAPLVRTAASELSERLAERPPAHPSTGDSLADARS